MTPEPVLKIPSREWQKTLQQEREIRPEKADKLKDEVLKRAAREGVLAYCIRS